MGVGQTCLQLYRATQPIEDSSSTARGLNHTTSGQQHPLCGEESENMNLVHIILMIPHSRVYMSIHMHSLTRYVSADGLYDYK